MVYIYKKKCEHQMMGKKERKKTSKEESESEEEQHLCVAGCRIL